MRRRDPGPTELEALDPVTGESLAVVPGSVGTTTDPRRTVRARRRRRLARLLALAAVACSIGAAYFGLSIAQLRGVERTWLTATELDSARADADRKVRQLVGDVEGDDDDALTAPLAAIGTEVAGRLQRHERALADRRIFDAKVSDLRDAMVQALEFRRFQLSPSRDRIGNTPLQRVEAGIATQLDRWGLSPSRAEPPELASLPAALAALRRYAPVETRAILFALAGTALHTIDVDRSRRWRREVPIVGDLISVSGGVAVNDGRRVLVYPPDPGAGPVAAIEDEDGGGNAAVAAGDGSGDLWVVQRGGTTVRRFRVDGSASGWSGEAARLPSGRTVVGSTFGHLVLRTPEGGLSAWQPSLPDDEIPLVEGGARFLDAEGPLVLFQGPLPFSPGRSSHFLHRFDVATGRRDLIGLPRTDAASASLSRGGVAAVAAGPLAGRLGSVLFLPPDGTGLTGGSSGPRASVAPGSIAWADDGESVFWLTPDGAVAIAHGTGPPTTRQLLRTGLSGLDRLTVAGR